MPDFDPRVATPPTSAYGPPEIDFSPFANLVGSYNKAFTDEQTKKLNQQRLQQGQQELDLTKEFQNGIPMKNGQPDYQAMMGIFAKHGMADKILQLAPLAAQQQQAGTSLYGDAPAASGPTAGQPSGPSSVTSRPLPAPAAGSPQGDSGSGTIASLVTDRMPQQDATTGQTIAKVAQTMGVDPNANLTPGQLRRAQGLVDRYAPAKSDNAIPTNLPPSAGAGTPAATPPQAPATRIASAFTSLQPGQGAPAGPPAQAQPGPQPQAQPAPQGPQGGAPQPQPFGLPATNPFNGKPITSPEEAANVVRAIEIREDQLRRQGVPEARISALEADKERIIKAFTPQERRPGASYVVPATGQVTTSNQGMLLSPEALDAAAETYRQTGKMPPNIGRGVQGDAKTSMIQNRATELEQEVGGDPRDWSTRWQKFSTAAAGRRVLENRAAGLTLAENEASSLIPRVRDISGKVSRTNYPNLNALILAAKKGTGGTDVIKLGVAVESLIPVYAKVLKPVGTVGAADMERAHDILDKAWSDGQINAALDQMEVELKSARSALDKSLDEFGTPASQRKDESRASGGSSQSSFRPPGDWQYSASRGQYRDPSGNLYDLNGNRVNDGR
jgi:hypothetical protein